MRCVRCGSREVPETPELHRTRPMTTHRTHRSVSEETLSPARNSTTHRTRQGDVDTPDRCVRCTYLPASVRRASDAQEPASDAASDALKSAVRRPLRNTLASTLLHTKCLSFVHVCETEVGTKVCGTFLYHDKERPCGISIATTTGNESHF